MCNEMATSDSAQNATCALKVDAEKALYTELWRACAGPLVTVPREGELVFYFPHGHIEQVEASTNQASDKQMPVYNLPSKIICRVINVLLKAESDIDEVYAQVTLMPEPNQDENATTKEPMPPPPLRFHVHSFCKTLTASDTSTHEGFFVLRRHADECLPLWICLSSLQHRSWSPKICMQMSGASGIYFGASLGGTFFRVAGVSL